MATQHPTHQSINRLDNIIHYNTTNSNTTTTTTTTTIQRRRRKRKTKTTITTSSTGVAMLVFVSSKLLVSHFRVVSGFSVTKLQPIHLRPTSVCTSSLIRNTQFPFQSLHCHHRFNIHTGTRGTFRSNDYVGRTTTTATTTRCFATTDKDKNNQQHLEEGFLTDLKQQFQVAVDLYESNLKGIPTNLNNIVNDLETEVADPSFWDADNKVRNAYVTSQLSKYRRLQQRRNDWTSWKEDGDAALEMLQAANADDTLFSPEERLSLARELEECSHKLIQEGDRYQLELLLSGPYDDQPCRILLTAGAGGTEANDWVADLKRMYERHAQKMGYALQIEDEQPGDVVGYKSVELLVSPGVGGGGSHPYGWFRGEKGTHRLVRLSPFNANNKRQTTFAGVDVAPLLDDNDLNDIEIPEKDLEITAMRSGGAGGQNVNKVNSAVRIKHLPSGLNVKCTQERSQAMNKDLAMKRLKAQLLAIAKEQRVAEIKEIRGDQVEASWGTQIRNYILHPYKLIKDQRTGWETSNVQNFLDGDLEECIAELLKTQAKEQQELQRETEQ